MTSTPTLMRLHEVTDAEMELIYKVLPAGTWISVGRDIFITYDAHFILADSQEMRMPVMLAFDIVRSN